VCGCLFDGEERESVCVVMLIKKFILCVETHRNVRICVAPMNSAS
jgi:hypothetical protein